MKIQSFLGILAILTLPGRMMAAEAPFHVRAEGIGIALNAQGEMVSCQFGKEGAKAVPITGNAALAGSEIGGAVAAEPVAGGGCAFTRQIKNKQGRRCQVRETFVPAAKSVRWELELVSADAPWTTEIVFSLKYPASQQTRFWTAWMNGTQWREGDAEMKADPANTIPDGKQWADPLVAMPMINRSWGYGEGYGTICLPLASILEPATDRGMSLVVSPDQALIKLQLATTAEGGVRFTHSNLRLGEGKKVVVSADLTAHEADWRGGLRWMVARYPDSFNPPNPRVTELEGTASYSNWRRPFKPEEVERLKKMAYRTQWVATFDWPYYVMYMPPMPSDDACWESCGHNASGNAIPDPKRVRKVSYRLMNEECRNFKDAGFHALSYFMLNEFGSDIVGPEKIKNELPQAESWKDANTMLYRNFPAAIVRNAEGAMLPKSWSRSVVVDPGEPNFHAYILEQARLTAERLPDSDGICIDRMDRLPLINLAPGADDQVGWYAGGRPGRAQGIAWQQIMARIGPMFHDRGKFIFANPAGWGYHLEWFRELDGIYDEFGYRGAPANGSALLGIRKPVFLWTENKHVQKTSAEDMAPDFFFQRHLHLGAYPSVPLEGNDHLIVPSPKADPYYVDYGPLMDAYRGKKWVLAPHCVEVAGNAAKANLFEVPDGYALPVTFGGAEKAVRITLRNLPGLEKVRCEALHPGAEKPVMLSPVCTDGVLRLEVPLQRGCAMVRVIQSPP